MAGDGISDDRGRTQLRGTCSDDAASRRSVRLPARVARTDVGVPLRLDPVSGDSDRDDCGSGCGGWKVSGHIRAVDLVFELDPASLESSTDSNRAHGAWQHGCRTEHAK